MNIKYTVDGRKVHIDSKLNENEYIIQEILIKNGKEVLGDKKTVIEIGQLYDELPDVAKTWKEKRLEEIELRYERFYDRKEKELNELERAHREMTGTLKMKMRDIKAVCENVRPEVFQMVEDYLSGKFKYFVVTNYHIKIVTMDYINETYDGKLRLISIFGKSDGTMTYARGEYYDYSGGHTTIIPFETYEEAVAYVSEYINNKESIGEDEIRRALEYGITIKPDLIKAYRAGISDTMHRLKDKYTDDIERMELKLDALRDLK